ncbi:MAG: DUF5655 domain-containing protein [Anaerolineae bacterium]
MTDLEKAYAAQLANIVKRTGKNLAELAVIVHASGLAKHGEIRAMLIRDLALSYGDANALAGHVLKSSGAGPAENTPTTDDIVAGFYSGAKAGLRPIHDQVMDGISTFGDFEIAPKKTYLALRRKKQFAMVGPGTKGRVEVGLNMKGVPATDRLIELPPGGMCNYVVRLTTIAEVDDELVSWIRLAYDSAG